METMKREIKFRAWSNRNKRMYCDPITVLYCLAQQQAHDTNSTTPGAMSIDHAKSFGMIWMQYTGLKDKNEKEIYEDDVVEFISYGVTFKEHVTWSDFWHETQMGDVHSGAGFEISNLSNSDECEIIGNIHENPELLKP